MGELGTVRRYPYWSDRHIKDVTADNGINLDRRWSFGFKTPALGPLPQAEFVSQRTAMQRHEIALKVEQAIGQHAVEDFVTPPPVAFAKGCTDITFATYRRWRSKKKKGDKAVMIHTRTESSNGCNVEVILFASIDNCAGYLSASAAEAPFWSSSSTGAIEEFIAHRGTRNVSTYDDNESIAVEILRVINNEGMTGKYVFQTRFRE